MEGLLLAVSTLQHHLFKEYVLPSGSAPKKKKKKNQNQIEEKRKKFKNTEISSGKKEKNFKKKNNSPTIITFPKGYLNNVQTAKINQNQLSVYISNVSQMGLKWVLNGF